MESNIKILKPKVEGVSCRDPKTREWLPAEGKAVRMDSFWDRRLLDDSVVEVMPSPATQVESKVDETQDKE